MIESAVIDGETYVTFLLVSPWSPHTQTFCYGLTLWTRGGGQPSLTILSRGLSVKLLNHPAQAPAHSVGSAPLSSFSAGPFVKSVFGQHLFLTVLQLLGGTFSPALSHVALLLLHWAESFAMTLVPRFTMGARNVVADSLSHQDQFLGSEWTLAQVVVKELG